MGDLKEWQKGSKALRHKGTEALLQNALRQKLSNKKSLAQKRIDFSKAMVEELQKYYLSKDEPAKGCLLALRSIILAQNAEITETVKYGMPCFCYKKKTFCYLWTDKKTKEPYILMVEGNRLHHPELEQGDRAKMKIFRVNPNLDLPMETILEVLRSGLELY